VAVNDYSYSIYSNWLRDASSPVEIGDRFLDLLGRLGTIDPVFQDWHFVRLVPDDPDASDDEEGPPMIPTRVNIVELVENNVARDDFWHPDPDHGYRPIAFTEPPERNQGMHLSVTAGSRFENEANLMTGDRTPLAAELVRYPLFRDALLAIVAVWRPAWARVQAFKMEVEYIPRGDLTEVGARSQHRMTWMAYLSADLARGLSLPPDLHTELTPDGGLLMAAAQDRLDTDNPTQMRLSDFLTAMMAERRPTWTPAPSSGS
jgi:hypothetical protein